MGPHSTPGLSVDLKMQIAPAAQFSVAIFEKATGMVVGLQMDGVVRQGPGSLDALRADVGMAAWIVLAEALLELKARRARDEDLRAAGIEPPV